MCDTIISQIRIVNLIKNRDCLVVRMTIPNYDIRDHKLNYIRKKINITVLMSRIFSALLFGINSGSIESIQYKYLKNIKLFNFLYVTCAHLVYLY